MVDDAVCQLFIRLCRGVAENYVLWTDKMSPWEQSTLNHKEGY